MFIVVATADVGAILSTINITIIIMTEFSASQTNNNNKIYCSVAQFSA